MRNQRSLNISFGGPPTPVVKYLLIACGAAFILQQLAGEKMLYIFGLVPLMVWKDFFLWQPISYIFLHGNLLHLLFNLFALYMFGCSLERLWGSWFFAKYFFVTGVGAALCTLCFSPFLDIPTIGASGAVFGILLAYALYYPDRIVYFNFIFPIKIKYLALIYGVLAFWFSFSGTGGGVAHIAHLGGMVIGFVYLNFYTLQHLMMKQIRKYKAARIRKRYRVIEGGKKAQRK